MNYNILFDYDCSTKAGSLFGIYTAEACRSLCVSGCSKYYGDGRLAMFGLFQDYTIGRFNDSTFCMVFKTKERGWDGRIILV